MFVGPFLILDFAPSHGPIEGHAYLGVGNGPTSATGIHKNHPQQGAFRAVIDDEMSPPRAFGGLQGERWVELRQHQFLLSVRKYLAAVGSMVHAQENVKIT